MKKRKSARRLGGTPEEHYRRILPAKERAETSFAASRRAITTGVCGAALTNLLLGARSLAVAQENATDADLANVNGPYALDYAKRDFKEATTAFKKRCMTASPSGLSGAHRRRKK